ncbi:MAG: acylphosphatase [Elusimicrobia bacterium]|nr:acylphosphatase [Elusimicrobiota bacterium]MBK7206721.1 acylphosphatase [Elusimicrobiota bacterium]MBK7545518.1 acylphosphatase [Elusimicrobiota bacterium]MBK7575291.1 acylphosphatase [Elusimicrobiota bacterium]MBK7687932.1 acylphosphatase [Elusimicrobiota bacterium]
MFQKSVAVERRRWRFFGRVQGVGFRAFCAGAACARGVRGWVRNEPDGSVSAEAEGPPGALDALRHHLEKAHPFARVDRWDEFVASPRRDDGEGFDIQG